MKALAISDARHLERFASTQVYYSLQNRDIEAEIVPVCLDQGAGILVWSPLAGGLLSGKYSRGKDGEVKGPKGSRLLTEWDEPPIDFPDRLFATINALKRVGKAHDVSAAQVALAWLLARPTVTSLIVGARTEKQLEDNLAAVDLRLSADETAKLAASIRADEERMLQRVLKELPKLTSAVYRAEVKGNQVQFALGYSHPVLYDIPEGIKIEIDTKANRVTVTGADRQKVGQVAAEIRGLRRPDPYKGKK